MSRNSGPQNLPGAFHIPGDLGANLFHGGKFLFRPEKFHVGHLHLLAVNIPGKIQNKGLDGGRTLGKGGVLSLIEDAMELFAGGEQRHFRGVHAVLGQGHFSFRGHVGGGKAQGMAEALPPHHAAVKGANPRESSTRLIM